jgi:hypothetical protein
VVAVDFGALGVIAHLASRFLERVRASLRHAFAVEDPSEPLNSDDLALLQRLADGIVRRRLAAPAVMFLESVRPLNFIGSQAMVFFNPIINCVIETKNFERMSAILERRSSVTLLIDMIEKGEGARQDLRKSEKSGNQSRAGQ